VGAAVTSNDEAFDGQSYDHQVEIKSNDRGYKLVLASMSKEHFLATLTGPGISLSNRVWLMGGDDWLADYWQKLAVAWTGWHGEMVWGSIENDLKLSAVHDGKGTITLKVEMQHGAPEGWAAAVYLQIEPGSLDTIAAKMNALRDVQLGRRPI
jgi:hypothetical protein